MNSNWSVKTANLIETDNEKFNEILSYFNKENIIKTETRSLILTTFNKINHFLNDVDKKIFNILEEHENEFLYQYKNQMIVVKNEINKIQKEMDENNTKSDNEKKINLLYEERNFFRAQSLKLFEENKNLTKKYNDLKIIHENLKQDKLYFENFLIQSKKENQDLKLEIQEKYDNYTFIQPNNNKYINCDSVYSREDINTNTNTYIKNKNKTNKMPNTDDLKNKIFKLKNQNLNLKKKIQEINSKIFQDNKNNEDYRELINSAIVEINKEKHINSNIFNRKDKMDLLILWTENELIKIKFFEFLNIKNSKDYTRTETTNYKIKTKNIKIQKNQLYYKFK